MRSIFTFILGFFFSQFLESNYPDKYLEIKTHTTRISVSLLTKIAFNILYVVSSFQIKYIKYFKPTLVHICTSVRTFLELQQIINGRTNYLPKLYFIKNGNKFHDMILSSKNSENFIKVDDINYDLIILDDYDNNKNRHNYICYTNAPTNFSYDESNISFMSIEFNHNKYINQFVLKDDARNYYIVGNIIDKKFVKYYIETYLSNEINEIDFENFKYTLSILDNEVNQIKIDETQSILIEKDSYKIIGNFESKEEEKEETKETENTHINSEIFDTNTSTSSSKNNSEEEQDKLYDFVNVE